MGLSHSDLKIYGLEIPRQLILSTALENGQVRGFPSFSFIEKIRKTKIALRVWNKNVFGHVKEFIEEKKAIIESLHNQTQTANNLVAELGPV